MVLVAVAVSGVLLGLLWLWLAPRVPLVSDDKAVFLKDTEGEEAVGADGTFVLLALAFGAVSAAAVFLFRRRGGVAAGGRAGAGRAARLAAGLGDRRVARPDGRCGAHARQVGQGVTFDAPLELQAKGALLAGRWRRWWFTWR